MSNLDSSNEVDKNKEQEKQIEEKAEETASSKTKDQVENKKVKKVTYREVKKKVLENKRNIKKISLHVIVILISIIAYNQYTKEDGNIFTSLVNYAQNYDEIEREKMWHRRRKEREEERKHFFDFYNKKENKNTKDEYDEDYYSDDFGYEDLDPEEDEIYNQSEYENQVYNENKDDDSNFIRSLDEPIFVAKNRLNFAFEMVASEYIFNVNEDGKCTLDNEPGDDSFQLTEEIYESARWLFEKNQDAITNDYNPITGFSYDENGNSELYTQTNEFLENTAIEIYSGSTLKEVDNNIVFNVPKYSIKPYDKLENYEYFVLFLPNSEIKSNYIFVRTRKDDGNCYEGMLLMWCQDEWIIVGTNSDSGYKTECIFDAKDLVDTNLEFEALRVNYLKKSNGTLEVMDCSNLITKDCISNVLDEKAKWLSKINEGKTRNIYNTFVSGGFGDLTNDNKAEITVMRTEEDIDKNIVLYEGDNLKELEYNIDNDVAFCSERLGNIVDCYSFAGIQMTHAKDIIFARFTDDEYIYQGMMFVKVGDEWIILDVIPEEELEN